ncbi:MAG: 4-(cytidine 5'-diphospho)-2-C-methyl-D-erythritol kinase [Roseobacter sp.]
MTMPEQVQAFAPAKVNLALHVTGQRADGYHLLDSMVMLLDVGDKLTVQRAAETHLTVTGPMAQGVPTDASNLVLKAAALIDTTASITLEKHLPAAAGIGGGSSDAAACLRALSRLNKVPVPGTGAQLSLGADVPVCMHNKLVRMRGIGEQLEMIGPPPSWSMILVNPRVQVPTNAVFNKLERKDNAGMTGDFPLSADWSEQVSWLAEQRNDLETPAIALAPVIGTVLQDLRSAQGCLFARMSGSGASCFAIMSSDAARDAAVQALRAAHPEWWIVPTQSCEAGFS